MHKSTDPIVYKGLTRKQVAEAYDDFISIPDFLVLLKENRERAQIVKNKLHPIQNIAYGNAPMQKLDIYAPKDAKQLPVLIDIHGGGWTAGSKDPRSIPAESIMSQSIIWVPIDYGLAPGYRIGDMISHVRSALAWVYENIFEYGGNPDLIYLSGHSSGAHLAATALMPGWYNDFGVPEDLIKGLIAVSGVYDLEGLLHADKNETQEILNLTLAEAESVSPFHHLPKKAIPTIISYGAKEPLAYAVESIEYAKKLESVGFNVSLIIVPDANHFDMLNELANREGCLFEISVEMINKKKCE